MLHAASMSCIAFCDSGSKFGYCKMAADGAPSCCVFIVCEKCNRKGVLAELFSKTKINKTLNKLVTLNKSKYRVYTIHLCHIGKQSNGATHVHKISSPWQHNLPRLWLIASMLLELIHTVISTAE